MYVPENDQTKMARRISRPAPDMGSPVEWRHYFAIFLRSVSCASQPPQCTMDWLTQA